VPDPTVLLYCNKICSNQINITFTINKNQYDYDLHVFVSKENVTKFEKLTADNSAFMIMKLGSRQV
jgi:glutaredoxin-related protein